MPLFFHASRPPALYYYFCRRYHYPHIHNSLCRYPFFPSTVFPFYILTVFSTADVRLLDFIYNSYAPSYNGRMAKYLIRCTLNTKCLPVIPYYIGLINSRSPHSFTRLSFGITASPLPPCCFVRWRVDLHCYCRHTLIVPVFSIVGFRLKLNIAVLPLCVQFIAFSVYNT